jgi:dihydrofolate reductase
MISSIDGFVEGPNGESDWVIPGEELHRHFNEMESKIDLHLFGRRTWEVVSGYWSPPFQEKFPSAPAYEVEYAEIWKDKPKIVFSKTLDKAEWNTRMVSSNIAEEVKKLKNQPGNLLWLDGGPSLAATLSDLGLIDEYWIYVKPIVLGGGKAMFSQNSILKLQLIDTQTFGGGVVLLRYGSIH